MLWRQMSLCKSHPVNNEPPHYRLFTWPAPHPEVPPLGPTLEPPAELCLRSTGKAHCGLGNAVIICSSGQIANGTPNVGGCNVGLDCNARWWRWPRPLTSFLLSHLRWCVQLQPPSLGIIVCWLRFMVSNPPPPPPHTHTHTHIPPTHSVQWTAEEDVCVLPAPLR